MRRDVAAFQIDEGARLGSKSDHLNFEQTASKLHKGQGLDASQLNQGAWWHFAILMLANNLYFTRTSRVFYSACVIFGSFRIPNKLAG